MKKIVLLLILIYPCCIFSQDIATSKWTGSNNPEKTGLLVSNRFVESPHNSFRPPTPPKSITYPEVCVWYGALRFAKVTDNNALLNQLDDRFKHLINNESHLIPKPAHVDNTVFGAVPFELFMQTKEKKYLDLALQIADAQWKMPENVTPDQAAGYKTLLDNNLTWQTRYWIDDMFMITMVQTQAYRATADRKYIDRTAYEMYVYLDTLQQANGLFYHSPDAPYFWGRGNGWMAAGMTELLISLPLDNKYRTPILASYLRMMESLKKYQKPSGLWGQLIDDKEAWDETSGSAMFTYAMIVGLKRGWLNKEKYMPVIEKAWPALVKHINSDGDIDEVCEGTNRKNDRQYYLDRLRKVGDMHGQAPVLWCAAALLEKP